LLCFHLVAALWVLFRAPSFEVAGQVLSGLGSGWDGARVAAVLVARRSVVLALGVCLVLVLAPPSWRQRLELRFRRAPWPAQAVLLCGVLAAAGALSSTELAPFIYFQF
jgi:hypothetical protein